MVITIRILKLKNSLLDQRIDCFGSGRNITVLYRVQSTAIMQYNGANYASCIIRDVYTHYHGDHVGLYKKIPKDIPLYIGPTAKKILEILIQKVDSVSETGEKGLSRVQNIRCYLPGRKELFGDIKITPFMTDHSALDSYMFLIEADGKKFCLPETFGSMVLQGRTIRLKRWCRRIQEKSIY